MGNSAFCRKNGGHERNVKSYQTHPVLSLVRRLEGGCEKRRIKRMKAKGYLHTLGGRPAYFDGQQIVFATRYGRAAKLCGSLKEIRQQQKLSNEWRRQQGFDEMHRADYVRVC